MNKRLFASLYSCQWSHLWNLVRPGLTTWLPKTVLHQNTREQLSQVCCMAHDKSHVGRALVSDIQSQWVNHRDPYPLRVCTPMAFSVSKNQDGAGDKPVSIRHNLNGTYWQCAWKILKCAQNFSITLLCPSQNNRTHKDSFYQAAGRVADGSESVHKRPASSTGNMSGSKLSVKGCVTNRSWYKAGLYNRFHKLNRFTSNPPMFSLPGSPVCHNDPASWVRVLLQWGKIRVAHTLADDKRRAKWAPLTTGAWSTPEMPKIGECQSGFPYARRQLIWHTIAKQGAITQVPKSTYRPCNNVDRNEDWESLKDVRSTTSNMYSFGFWGCGWQSPPSW